MIKKQVQDRIEVSTQEAGNRWASTVLNAPEENITLGLTIRGIDSTNMKDRITNTKLNQNKSAATEQQDKMER